MNSLQKNTMSYFTKRERITPKIYYHYTSVEALYNIVQNHTFWLTNLKSSNDKKELSYSYQMFKDDISSIINNETDELRKEKITSLVEFNIERAIPAFFLKPSEEPYALCLSRQSDNLTHWDRYTNKSIGVCIAINIAALEVLYSRKELSIYAWPLFQIEHVVYSKDDRITLLNKKVDETISMLYNQEDPEEFMVSATTLILALSSVYADIKNFVKWNAFYDEDEIRLFYSPLLLDSTRAALQATTSEPFDHDPYFVNMQSEFERMIENMDIEKKCFGVFSSGIRSYHKLCLSEIWGNGLIPEITLGPMCTQDKKELRAFLDANGLRGTKITESKVPIR